MYKNYFQMHTFNMKLLTISLKTFKKSQNVLSHYMAVISGNLNDLIIFPCAYSNNTKRNNIIRMRCLFKASGNFEVEKLHENETLVCLSMTCIWLTFGEWDLWMLNSFGRHIHIIDPLINFWIWIFKRKLKELCANSYCFEKKKSRWM